MPITRIANGIQNHTAAIAAPVIIDARRHQADRAGGVAAATSAGSGATAGPGR